MDLGPGPEIVDAIDGYHYRINRCETHFIVERCSVGLPGSSLSTSEACMPSKVSSIHAIGETKVALAGLSGVVSTPGTWEPRIRCLRTDQYHVPNAMTTLQVHRRGRHDQGRYPRHRRGTGQWGRRRNAAITAGTDAQSRRIVPMRRRGAVLSKRDGRGILGLLRIGEPARASQWADAEAGGRRGPAAGQRGAVVLPPQRGSPRARLHRRPRRPPRPPQQDLARPPLPARQGLPCARPRDCLCRRWSGRGQGLDGAEGGGGERASVPHGAAGGVRAAAGRARVRQDAALFRRRLGCGGRVALMRGPPAARVRLCAGS